MVSVLFKICPLFKFVLIRHSSHIWLQVVSFLEGRNISYCSLYINRPRHLIDTHKFLLNVQDCDKSEHEPKCQICLVEN